MFKRINTEGKGAVLFINQETPSFNVLNRLQTIKELQNDKDVIKAPKVDMDTKDFGIGAQILHDLNIHKLKLVSNSKQQKRVGMIGYGLEIVEYVIY